jgi:small subunit ribosomal protein S4
MGVISIGAKHRMCRKIGTPLCGSARCPSLERPYPPGQHGMNAARKQKKSVFAMQLAEKQKLKFIYGVAERQLKNLFKQSAQKKGQTGHHLLALLESRLDNIVYRLGFAPGRPSARQLVSHRHIKVNDRTVDIPSYKLKVGDSVKVSDASRLYKSIKARLEKSDYARIAPYLALKRDVLEGKLINPPRREEIFEPIEENLIVEYYAK